MAQLPNSNFSGVSLEQCGLLFLATPHTGSTKADWSNFLTAVAHTVTGVRPETVTALESFSTESVWDKQAFFNLKPRPHFRCLAEGRKMPVAGTYQHVRFYQFNNSISLRFTDNQFFRLSRRARLPSTRETQQL